jgi:hypothetical protein
MPEMNEELTRAVIQNMLTLYVEPEIKRRHDAGVVASLPMPLQKVQIIIPGDGSEIKVRLNDEARISADVNLRPDVPPTIGEQIGFDEIGRVNYLFPADAEDQNSGHVEMIWSGDKVLLGFDFRYNRAKASKLVPVGREFLEAARHAKDTQRSWSVFVEALFSALELATKAFLWTTPWGQTFRARMPHPAIRENFARFPTVLNNLEAQRIALSDLASERNSARYLHSEIVPRWEDGEGWFSSCEAMLRQAEAQIAGPLVAEPAAD